MAKTNSFHSNPYSSTVQQGQQVDLEITDLTDSGDGVGRAENGFVIFVPDTVPGDRVRVRLVQIKADSGLGKLQDLLEASPHRTRPSCIVADKCGGCQWQHIDYPKQLQAKQAQVIQALQRLGDFPEPPVNPVLTRASAFGYRNKVTYPIGVSATTGQVQIGYYQKNSHKLINLNQCPVQDADLNPLLAEVKQDIQQQGWPVYDEKRRTGELRHLSLRIGRRTGEILLTLVVRTGKLTGLHAQADQWLKRYPQLVGVCLNLNGANTNAIFGDQTRCIAGRPYLREIFAGLTFELRPETFFQVNTETAEALLHQVIQELSLQGHELLVDAYCGVGTFSLPFAQRVQQVMGLEVQTTAVEQARRNAELNHISNVEFQAGAVETILPQLTRQPDLILLDPPRKGCHPAVLAALLQMQPSRIVYISCKAATLARDLKRLCQSGTYQLTRVQPADFFPQTSHVECAAFLTRR